MAPPVASNSKTSEKYESLRPVKPFDPRLIRYAKSARSYIALIAGLGFLTALLVIAQDVLIAWIISPVITDGMHLGQVIHLVWILAGVAVARALVMFVRESQAHKAATKTIVELRHQVLRKAMQLGPRWQARKGADTVTLLTRALDDLGPYFVNYLPQLVLTCTVTPAALAVMLWLDWLSAIVAVITIPLIPIFMILIGKLTQEASNRRLASMQQLGRELLDLISGLTTLKALGRERGPIREVRRLGDNYARTTMRTLSVAFLSGGVLEFLATLSVALVAVETGFRLVYGNIELAPALAVIMLAPEVYLPLREVGKQFHASSNGLAAAQSAFAVLEAPTPKEGTIPAPALEHTTIEASSLSVAARGMWAPKDLHFTLQPGSMSALVGPSGVGKSTTVMALLGLQQFERGQISLVHSGSTLALPNVDMDSWRQQITWVPQSPVLLPGTILENICDDAQRAHALCPDGVATGPLAKAAKATGFDKVVAQAEEGLATPIGQGGVGLSVGQRQRLALTRALLGKEQLVILDEPTAHLDAHLEAQVTAAVEELKAQGKTILLIAHRIPLLKLADQLIEVSSGKMTEADKDALANPVSGASSVPLEEYGFLDERAVEQK